MWSQRISVPPRNTTTVNIKQTRKIRTNRTHAAPRKAGVRQTQTCFHSPPAEHQQTSRTAIKSWHLTSTPFTKTHRFFSSQLHRCVP